MFPTIRSAATVLFAATLAGPPTALAEDGSTSPGEAAIEQFREGRKSPKAVENRFFLKQERFEVAPVFGYVPNNPFARRYVGGVIVGYHFTEVLAASVYVGYSPDGGEGDLKGLTAVLLDRAYNAQTQDGPSFQQPLDKVTLFFNAGVQWSPVYGKINLAGETVLNFDLYGFLGVGMVSKENFVASYDQSADPDAGEDIVLLEDLGNEVRVSPVVGIGQNYFLNQSMSLKIDARASFYVDDKPQYDPDIPPDGSRLYNNFTASVGLAIYFPRMKPRLYDF
ncbi:MAG: outer membrane beta-barrel protein [Myxococcota bacterium]|jgi:outer membrane beta-barrel protein